MQMGESDCAEQQVMIHIERPFIYLSIDMVAQYREWLSAVKLRAALGLKAKAARHVAIWRRCSSSLAHEKVIKTDTTIDLLRAVQLSQANGALAWRQHNDNSGH